MKALRSAIEAATPRRLAAGLLVALIVAVGAGTWLRSRALDGLGGAYAERVGLASLAAVADLVERTGLDDGSAQAAVAAYVAANPAVGPVRVVRFQGIRLVASTAPEDTGKKAAPRKMARDEKPLYDLGQSLRANVDTNRDEGRAWKEEIDVQTTDDGRLSLAAPVAGGDTIVGSVHLETERATIATPRPSYGLAFAFVLVPVVLFLGLARLIQAPAARLAVAAALAVVALGIYGFLGSDLEAGRLAIEEAVGDELAAEAGRVAAVLTAEGITAEGITAEIAGDAPAAWSYDLDPFRRPRGLHTEDGIARESIRDEIGVEIASLRRFGWWIGAGALLIFAWIGLGGAAQAGRNLIDYREAYAYVVPALAGMLILVFFPFFYGIALSFTNQSIYNTDQPLTEIWVGVDNFKEILTDFEIYRDTEGGRAPNYQNFYWTLGFTIIWTVTNVAVGVTVGLILALILNRKGLALRPIYRVLLILPWAMPNYITALIWKGMFHSQFGVINQVLQMLGGDPVSWFDKPYTAFLTVLSTNGWLSFPFMMVICLGALQSIPADLYEAARVDGANRFQQFWAITLPSLKPALVPAVILSVVWTFNMFNIIYLVSEGEPGGSTEILITEAYKIAFEQYRYGYAAAYSTVIFVILLGYGIWQNRVTGATEGI